MARRTTLLPVSVSLRQLRVSVSLLVLTGALTLAAPAAAQQQTPTTSEEFVLNGEIPLFENLGSHTRSVTTDSADAQAYFDQGLRLAYAFGRHEAQQSFVAAARKDPLCASCRWGLAWALGPYANGAMDSGAEAIAYQQAQEARRLGAGSAEVEQALIDALLARYAPVADADKRAQLDTAYMVAMRDVYRRFPEDLDVATMYAESMMVLRLRNYWTRAGNPQPGTNEVLRVLEGVIDRDIRHPGACHLYIHATEASLQPGRATGCADVLGDAMPGASHMVHMPSHTYMRTGRYGDAVRWNQLARLADQEAQHGGATAIYPDHNLHMLLVAASYDGQSAVAIQAARDLAQLAPGSAHHVPLVFARFGRWEDILKLPTTGVSFAGAILSYARGLAQVRTNRVADARESLVAVEGEIQVTEIQVTEDFRRGHALLKRIRLDTDATACAGDSRGGDRPVAGQDFDSAVRTIELARVIETDSMWIRMSLRTGSCPCDRCWEQCCSRSPDVLSRQRSAYRGELEAQPGEQLVQTRKGNESTASIFALTAAQGKTDEAAAGGLLPVCSISPSAGASRTRRRPGAGNLIELAILGGAKLRSAYHRSTSPVVRHEAVSSRHPNPGQRARVDHGVLGNEVVAGEDPGDHRIGLIGR